MDIGSCPYTPVLTGLVFSYMRILKVSSLADSDSDSGDIGLESGCGDRSSGDIRLGVRPGAQQVPVHEFIVRIRVARGPGGFTAVENARVIDRRPYTGGSNA